MRLERCLLKNRTCLNNRFFSPVHAEQRRRRPQGSSFFPIGSAIRPHAEPRRNGPSPCVAGYGTAKAETGFLRRLFSMCSKKTIQAGFSIIEVIVALAIFAMAGIAVWTLAANSLKTARLGRQELIAANLAQEGIEIVRNMRDSNWLRTDVGSRDNDNGTNCAPAPPVSWRDRLCDGNYRAQYDNPNLLALGSNPLLQIAGTGFYQYASGTATSFRRRIQIV